MINTADFKELCAENSIHTDDEKAHTLDIFAQYLISENEKYNLTAIKSPEAVMLRHFCDSLVPVPFIKEDSKLLDIGSGAGFPAVPIAISRSDVSVTAMDATAKKTAFINGAAEKMQIRNLTAISGRAEELAKNPEYRENFDVVTARAVSALRILCELSAQFLKVGGVLIALKGDPETTEAEIKEAERTASAVGLSFEKTEEFTLCSSKSGETLQRTLVFMRKTKKTPNEYPRRYAQIVKGSI